MLKSNDDKIQLHSTSVIRVRKKERFGQPYLKSSSSLGQFHQYFTSSFYASRSQKRKKDSQVKQLFELFGSVCVKAGRRHVDEIDHPSFSLGGSKGRRND